MAGKWSITFLEGTDYSIFEKQNAVFLFGMTKPNLVPFRKRRSGGVSVAAPNGIVQKAAYPTSVFSGIDNNFVVC